ncbi:MAG TPA: glycine--tRNA ligase subunit beta [Gammaproteobacteria bacterium]|nr:glycine--tRNA ligase subunit beta [Gammaproteobacteria bacterium]
MAEDFLVEIGTEELPPRRLRAFGRDFHERVVKAVSAAGLIDAGAASEWYCSPRRLAVLIPDVRSAEPDRVEERLGPAVTAAFDAGGKPTKAAEGFARSCGVAVDELKRRQTDKGERLAYRQQVNGRPAASVLAEAVATAVSGMSIPRRMRWGAGDAGFIRPVHWLVMLHGNEVVECELLGVAAGRETRGHRFHHPEPIKVTSPSDYAALLRKSGHVEVDDSAGHLAAVIQGQAIGAAQRAGGHAAEAPDLATEVAALVEWPVPIVGSFAADFLALPEEVVVAVLEGQQRYFPIRDADDQLMPHFVAIGNIDSRDPDAIRRGNERVVRPRLADAMFFWQTDLKTPLAKRAAELEEIVFQAGLGSLADKAQRIAALAAEVAPGDDVDAALLARAASLCKCDLVTDMVGEFPELQGIMGGHYAAADGEPAAVAEAIREHYLPQQSGDPIPASAIGQRLAIADKLDTIAGVFALGKRPSGDRDPFALRRAAAGIVRIALEAPLDIELAKLIGAAVAAQPVPVKDRAALIADIRAFILDRLRSQYDIRIDVVDAVLALELDNPADIDARITALAAFVDQPAAQSLAAANKRCANILRQADMTGDRSPKAEDLIEAAEVDLYDAIEASRDDVAARVAERDYKAALATLATLREPVDKFFDDVLVMDERADVRLNRLALLDSLHRLFSTTADWARIQVESERS